jgi:hypothetical protein
MFKVRFHLQRGENFMKWQVKKGDTVLYYSPDDFCLILKKCTLRNIPKISQRILKGGSKTVCAWIQCESYEVVEKNSVDTTDMNIIRFNPRFMPYWINESQENIDDSKFDAITTLNRSLYV